MKSIEELQADLKLIYAELEERRQAEEETAAKIVNFDEISSKSERCKIENHPMNGRDEHEQSMYLFVLLSVIALDDAAYEKSFSLLCRIAHGMGFKGNVQDLFLQAQQVKFDRLDEITRLFIKDDVRLVMLMECMMLAQSFKKEYKKAIEYIAELCTLMKLDKEQITMVSNIARAILMQNVAEYRCNIKNTFDVFDCYLYPLEKAKKLEIVIVYVDCRNYTSHEYRRITTYQGKTYSNDWDTLDLTFVGKNGSAFQYSYPSRINYTCNVDGSNTTKTGERTIDLFQPKSGHECISYKERLTDGEYSNVLVSVTSNAPNLAYNLAMKRFKEAGGITEEEGE